MRTLSLRHLSYWALHPRRWQEAVRRVQASWRGRRWCEERAVDADTALKHLGMDPFLPDLRSLFPHDFEESIIRQHQCPHKLGGSGNLSLLYGLCSQLRSQRVVETGVAYGWSSLAILLALKEQPQGHLWSTDLPYPFLQHDAEDCVGIVVPEHLRDRWTLYRTGDRESLPQALAEAESVDLAHYDSDKSAEAKRWALETIWSHLRPGGVLVCDDVNDDLVFRDFCSFVGVTPLIVGNVDTQKFQGLARK